MSNDLGLLMLRLCAGGFMFWGHGLNKFLNYSQYVTQFADPIGAGLALSLQLAIFAELVCAALVTLGLFTRLSLIPLAFTMFVAAFVVHAEDPFNKKELALVYLIMYLVLFFMGSGRYSIQNIFQISAGRFSWFLK